jgi:hypothetical protein
MNPLQEHPSPILSPVLIINDKNTLCTIPLLYFARHLYVFNSRNDNDDEIASTLLFPVDMIDVHSVRCEPSWRWLLFRGKMPVDACLTYVLLRPNVLHMAYRRSTTIPMASRVPSYCDVIITGTSLNTTTR